MQPNPFFFNNSYATDVLADDEVQAADASVVHGGGVGAAVVHGGGGAMAVVADSDYGAWAAVVADNGGVGVVHGVAGVLVGGAGGGADVLGDDGGDVPTLQLDCICRLLLSALNKD